jgi:transcriptional regulator with XRE-family HTH domain
VSPATTRFFMTQIGSAIRNTRKSLGKTMAEFAEMIGCKQGTVSRYEAGRLTPSRAVLILLLQLAKGADREIILGSLGVDRSTRSEWSERDLLDALKTFEDYLAIPGKQAKRARGNQPVPASPLAAFAKAAKRILLERPEPDPALVTILEHWLGHRANRKAHQYFRHVAAYLDVELSVLQAGTKDNP